MAKQISALTQKERAFYDYWMENVKSPINVPIDVISKAYYLLHETKSGLPDPKCPPCWSNVGVELKNKFARLKEVVKRVEENPDVEKEILDEKQKIKNAKISKTMTGQKRKTPYNQLIVKSNLK